MRRRFFEVILIQRLGNPPLTAFSHRISQDPFPSQSSHERDKSISRILLRPLREHVSKAGVAFLLQSSPEGSNLFRVPEPGRLKIGKMEWIRSFGILTARGRSSIEQQFLLKLFSCRHQSAHAYKRRPPPAKFRQQNCIKYQFLNRLTNVKHTALPGSYPEGP